MKLGVLVNLNAQSSIAEKIKKVHDMGFGYCQISCWDMACYNDETADQIKAACAEYGVTVSTLWTGWSGRGFWNFYEGQHTLGLVPEAYRFQRILDLKAGSDFAKKLGVGQIATHAGFIPEDPTTEKYHGLIYALREVASYVKDNGQYFLFETGQETPITVVRAIHDIGTGNAGINFDTANVILYGKSSAVDSVKIFGQYVRNLHLKDGNFPTDPYHLGKETPLGEGSVNVPEVLRLLKECGYTGPYIMEREISGEKQIEDIKNGRELVLSVLKSLEE